MQAGLEEHMHLIVVAEQTICAFHLILSTAPIATSGVQGRSYMYGVENEHPIGGTGNDDATCAVCYVSTRGTRLMFPAKTSCLHLGPGEYYG